MGKNDKEVRSRILVKEYTGGLIVLRDVVDSVD
jgi:hypothetical protein